MLAYILGITSIVASNEPVEYSPQLTVSTFPRHSHRSLNFCNVSQNKVCAVSHSGTFVFSPEHHDNVRASEFGRLRNPCLRTTIALNCRTCSPLRQALVLWNAIPLFLVQCLNSSIGGKCDMQYVLARNDESVYDSVLPIS